MRSAPFSMATHRERVQIESVMETLSMPNPPSSQTRIGPWLVVVFCFLALALAFSMRAALGLVMPVWERELHWTKSFISGAGATALIVMACVAPFAGRFVD